MPIRFIFVISPRTHLLDLAGPDQVFFEAIFFKAPFVIEYCSFAPEEAGTSAGLRFAGLRPYSELEPKKGDYIVIPGMDVDVIDNAPGGAMQGLFRWLRAAYAQGANLCSICTGAFLLAAGGLLDGKICTTHWKYTRKLQARHPRLKVQENVLFTEKDGIFTSAGIASGVDMALHIVEKEMGAHFAHKVAREIVVYIRRNGGQAQESVFLSHRNHLHAGIHAVQDWLLDNLDRKATLPELAEMAHMSTRNFTRTFRKETGVTIGDYLTLLRREKIAELLKKPDLSRPQIARQVGLKSARQLGRLLSREG